MPRDIDYAAIAVQKAIDEKFGRSADLQHLTVTAGEKTIAVRDPERSAKRGAAGTRDDLLAAIRAAESYENLWELLARFPAAVD
jgi:hypothetical protein